MRKAFGLAKLGNAYADGALGGSNGFSDTQIDDIFRAAMQV